MKITIKVRKPEFNFFKILKFWFYGYSYSYEKWQNALPKEGDCIKLIWLPNPINNPGEKSCYIGSKGIVTDLDKLDGTFNLKLENGALLLNLGNDFDYELLLK